MPRRQNLTGAQQEANASLMTLAVFATNAAEVPRETVSDDVALCYIEWVDERFKDKPGVCQKFLDYLRTAKTDAFSAERMIRAILSLFAGHWDLIMELNQYLPKDFAVDVTQDFRSGSIFGFWMQDLFFPTGFGASKETVKLAPHMLCEVSEDVAYVDRVRVTLNDERRFKRFLELLNEGMAERIPCCSLQDRLQVVLKGHENLIDELFIVPYAGPRVIIAESG